MAIGTESDALTSELDRWVAEAKAGSSVALANLIILVREQLKKELGDGPIRGLSPSRSGSDLAQDTALVICKKFPRFKKQSYKEFKRWARGILHRPIGL